MTEIDADELARMRETTNRAVLRMREAESKVTSSKGAATRARNDRTIAINERDSARAQLAAKDREIAALREALKEARACCYPHTRYKIDAALEMSGGVL